MSDVDSAALRAGAAVSGAGADSARWRDYYLCSAAAYEQVATIDRDHYHESLYCAGRERRKAEAITLGATGPVGGVSDTI